MGHLIRCEHVRQSIGGAIVASLVRALQSSNSDIDDKGPAAAVSGNDSDGSCVVSSKNIVHIYIYIHIYVYNLLYILHIYVKYLCIYLYIYI